jgi:hypothetical protein
MTNMVLRDSMLESLTPSVNPPLRILLLNRIVEVIFTQDRNVVDMQLNFTIEFFF